MSKYEGSQPPERDSTPESLVPDVRTGIAEIRKDFNASPSNPLGKSCRVCRTSDCGLCFADLILDYVTPLIEAEHLEKMKAEGWRQVDPKKLPVLTSKEISRLWNGVDDSCECINVAKAQRSLDLKSLGIMDKKLMLTPEEVKQGVANIVKSVCHFAVKDGKCPRYDKCENTNCSFANGEAERIVDWLILAGLGDIEQAKREEMERIISYLQSLYVLCPDVSLPNIIMLIDAGAQ